MQSSTYAVFNDEEKQEQVIVRDRRIEAGWKRWFGTSGLCELCWRPTEYECAAPRLKQYRQRRRGIVEQIQPCFPDDDSANQAEQILEIFMRCLNNEYDKKFDKPLLDFGVTVDNDPRYIAPRIVTAIGVGKFTLLHEKYRHLCEQPCGQISVADIKRHASLCNDLLALIEDALVAERQKRPDLLERADGRPSKRFCEFHNQCRSEQSRRLYKRDHAKQSQFHDKFAELQSHLLREKLIALRNNDIDAIAAIRKAAYKAVHAEPLKPKKRRQAVPHGEIGKNIDRLLVQGITNLSEIARQLGVTRAAVSIAIKRKSSLSL